MPNANFLESLKKLYHREGDRGLGIKLKYFLRYFLASGWKTLPPNPRVNLNKEGKATFTVIIPAYKSRANHLKSAVRSVLNQSYPNWELRIVYNQLSSQSLSILEKFARKDNRIKLIPNTENQGIAKNTNLGGVNCKSDYIALLDHDDLISQYALEYYAQEHEKLPFEIAYCDEDRISSNGMIHYPPNLKGDWAPELITGLNYICHFLVIRRTLFENLGGMDSKYDGAQDHDFILRAKLQGIIPRYISKILYHWRIHSGSTASSSRINAKPYATQATYRAVESHLREAKVEAKLISAELPGIVQIRYLVRSSPKIEIIIPSANKNQTLFRCLESLSNYPSEWPYKLSVILNGDSSLSTTKKKLKAYPEIKVFEDSLPFNFSRVNNFVANQSSADIFLFMNDDIEAIQSDWLLPLIEIVNKEEVGIAGSLLLYPDNSIQHAGISLNWDRIGTDYHAKLKRTSYGFGSRLKVAHEVSAVTGACLAIRRKIFKSVGGFDESFRLAFNDIDLCQKVRARGYSVILTPHSVMRHHESVSRGYDISGDKLVELNRAITLMQKKWGVNGLKEKYVHPRFYLNTDLVS